jgi:hypothetical protein
MILFRQFTVSSFDFGSIGISGHSQNGIKVSVGSISSRHVSGRFHSGPCHKGSLIVVVVNERGRKATCHMMMMLTRWNKGGTGICQQEEQAESTKDWHDGWRYGWLAHRGRFLIVRNVSIYNNNKVSNLQFDLRCEPERTLRWWW